MKCIKQVFSIKNSSDQIHKEITLLGIKINFKRRKTLLSKIETMLDNNRIKTIQGVQRSINTALLHQKTFLPYKNCNREKDVFLIGAGPTLNCFEPVKNSIYVGCNRAFLFDKINFDYLFTIDKAGLDIGSENYYSDFFRYNSDKCVKFIGDQNLGKDFQIPESEILKYEVKRYKTTAGYLPDTFAFDIDSMPVGNCASVSLQAIQFILYTNPKKVYLVGIDCTVASNGHFIGATYDNNERNENAEACDRYNIEKWKELKEFAQTYYPETEIISVNPVGLKGLFKDVYTKSYIELNPQILSEYGENIVYVDEI